MSKLTKKQHEMDIEMLAEHVYKQKVQIGNLKLMLVLFGLLIAISLVGLFNLSNKQPEVVQGPPGPQGPVGPQGPPGPQGPAGANGVDGANARPPTCSLDPFGYGNIRCY